MLYTVYILYSASHDKIYIGYTSNLLERFKSHNHLGTKGYTIRYRPWTVIYCEHFSNKETAMNIELKLKGGKEREWIWQKIKTDLKEKGFISA